jgi:hypothetical protein
LPTLAGLWLLSCGAKYMGGSLFLADNVAPAAPPTCTVDSGSNIFISDGLLDVSISQSYEMNPRVINNMVAQSGVPLKWSDPLGSNTLVLNDMHDVYIDGFNVCYEKRQNNVPPANPNATCADIASVASGFIPSQGAVVPSGGKTAVGVNVLPKEIYDKLGINLNKGDDPQTLLVHLQGSGRTKDGSRILTNEIVYPIRLCFGCLDVTPACTALKQIPDPTSVCLRGQDEVQKCIAPPTTP